MEAVACNWVFKGQRISSYSGLLDGITSFMFNHFISVLTNNSGMFWVVLVFFLLGLHPLASFSTHL